MNKRCAMFGRPAMAVAFAAAALLASQLTAAAASGWNVVSSPSPGSLENDLQGVTCVGADECWAVGSSFDSSGNTVTLIEENTGSGWSIVSSPNVTGTQYDDLASVTCAGPDECWAVGQSAVGPFIDGEPLNGFQTLIEEYNGSAWTVVSSPSIVGETDEGLDAVACGSTSECWATGFFHTSSSADQTLIEKYNGSAWSVDSDAERDGSLDGVTCVAANECWAVGSSVNDALVDEFAGSTWTAVSTLSTGFGDDGLSGVTCTTANSCWAVGSSVNGSGAERTLIEGYSGSTWSITTSPDTGSGSAELAAVACASADECWAVGFVNPASTSTFEPLFEENTGSGWTVASGANPGGDDTSLDGVTCLATGVCWSVGLWTNSAASGAQQTLIEEYTPSSSTPTPTPTPTATGTPSGSSSTPGPDLITTPSTGAVDPMQVTGGAVLLTVAALLVSVSVTALVGMRRRR